MRTLKRIKGGISERERGRKKRKRSAVTVDGINAVFADAIGRKLVRSAPEVPDPAPAPTPVKSGTKKANLALKQGRGQGDQSIDYDVHAGLGAVVDAIKVAPRHEGQKRSSRHPSDG